jgi:aromatic-amino-acid transaminase
VQRLLLGATAKSSALGARSPCRRSAERLVSRWAPTSCARFAPAPRFISDPSWENHRALIRGAGFEVKTIRITTRRRTASTSPRCAPRSRRCSRVDRRAARVLPQPHRRRPDAAQWDEIIGGRAIARAVPFLDLAYQEFGDGIDADAAVVRRFAATPGPAFVSNSFSKSFSLYGERVGALTVVTADKDEAARVLSAAEAVRARELLEPADARRPDRARSSWTPQARARSGRWNSADARAHPAKCATRW